MHLLLLLLLIPTLRLTSVVFRIRALMLMLVGVHLGRGYARFLVFDGAGGRCGGGGSGAGALGGFEDPEEVGGEADEKVDAAMIGR